MYLYASMCLKCVADIIPRVWGTTETLKFCIWTVGMFETGVWWGHALFQWPAYKCSIVVVGSDNKQSRRNKKLEKGKWKMARGKISLKMVRWSHANLLSWSNPMVIGKLPHVKLKLYKLALRCNVKTTCFLRQFVLLHLARREQCSVSKLI